MTTGDAFRAALERVTKDEVATLAALLEVSLSGSSGGFVGRRTQDKLWSELSYYGSNNLAYLLRGNEGVDYPEIVRDVCNRQKIKRVRETDTLAAVEHNEVALIKALFENMWDQLGEEERRALLESLGVGEMNGSAGAAMAMQFAARLGGFGTYQLAVIVANAVGRALLGQGLSFGANAALTRGLSLLIGPVGWIASGAWFMYDVANPALRKTLPAVVIVATLRQLTKERQFIGVMGEGSTGKDTLLKAIFGVDTKEISPIPGQTDKVAVYSVENLLAPAHVVNFPGFGDLRADVHARVQEHARTCSLLIYLVDRIPQKAEVEHYSVFVKNAGVPFVVLFNKWDNVDEEDRRVSLSETKKRLKLDSILCVCLKESKDKSLFGRSVQDIWDHIDAASVKAGYCTLFRHR